MTSLISPATGQFEFPDHIFPDVPAPFPGLPMAPGEKIDKIMREFNEYVSNAVTGISQDSKEQVHKLFKWAREVADFAEGQPGLSAIVINTAKDVIQLVAEMQTSEYRGAALYILGIWYLFGLFGMDRSNSKARELFFSSAKLGYSRSLYRLASDFEAQGDVPSAVSYFEHGVKKGDAACLYRMGMAYLRGHLGKTVDIVLGLRYLEKSSLISDPDCPQSAYMYGLIQLGELPNIAAANPQVQAGILALERSAWLGFVPALIRMGKAWQGGEKGYDSTVALRYFHLASRSVQYTKMNNGGVDNTGNAQGGAAEAEISKWMLCGSDGVFEPNEEWAFKFSAMAAEYENPIAEFAMGYFYEVGIYVNADLTTALEWYRLSAKRDCPDAKARLAELEPTEELRAATPDAIVGRRLTRKDHERTMSVKGRRSIRSSRKELYQQTKAKRQSQEINNSNIVSQAPEMPPPPPPKSASRSPSPPSPVEVEAKRAGNPAALQKSSDNQQQSINIPKKGHRRGQASSISGDVSHMLPPHTTLNHHNNDRRVSSPLFTNGGNKTKPPLEPVKPIKPIKRKPLPASSAEDPPVPASAPPPPPPQQSQPPPPPPPQQSQPSPPPPPPPPAPAPADNISNNNASTVLQPPLEEEERAMVEAEADADKSDNARHISDDSDDDDEELNFGPEQIDVKFSDLKVSSPTSTAPAPPPPPSAPAPPPPISQAASEGSGSPSQSSRASTMTSNTSWTSNSESESTKPPPPSSSAAMKFETSAKQAPVMRRVSPRPLSSLPVKPTTPSPNASRPASSYFSQSHNRPFPSPPPPRSPVSAEGLPKPPKTPDLEAPNSPSTTSSSRSSRVMPKTPSSSSLKQEQTLPPPTKTPPKPDPNLPTPMTFEDMGIPEHNKSKDKDCVIM
ncbi:hypothetical protein TRICI_006893 [Trichomonascus ciferrii]|uniref:Uncharacterized protein n=1 Tax=Trichomonascus ciferrii TaxID=44093 RepID=A0A6A1LJN4_9ASCO|nr:hypothetical protein TRICI_006893 [Trichomonascus ciferrii]